MAAQRIGSWASVSEADAADHELLRSPSSPSNSWSSAETAQLPADSPLAEGGEGRRPKRCKISREQLSVLIKSFEEEPLPNFDQRQNLAKVLGMTPRSVQIWFQNRRQRLKPMQPKAGGDGRAGLDGRHAERAAQAHLGGLAAAAGLCGGTGIDQLMMNHALSQLPNHGLQHSSSYPHSLHSYGDVMEPFAATKALLSAGGAMGLSPSHRAASAPPSAIPSLGSAIPPQALVNGLGQMAPSHADALIQAHMSQRASSTSPSAANYAAHYASSAAVAQQQPPPPTTCQAPPPAPSNKADGLLLLLACADSGAPPEVGVTPSTAQAVSV